MSSHRRGRDAALARLTAPGSRYEIRTENVLGEQLEVFAHRERTLGELLRASGRFEDGEYLVDDGFRLTFDAHLASVAAVANALQDKFGVGKGDRVAICSANSAEWVIAFWAVSALGAITVGMNSLWAKPEIDYAIDNSEPTLIIADAPRRQLIGDVSLPVLSVEEAVPALIAEYSGCCLPEDVADEDDPVVILYTSGTSGRPKGATHSHRNVIAACWFHLLNDAIAAELGQAPSRRRYLMATPLFHIAALHNLAVVRLAVGDTAVIYSGRFDIARVLELIEVEGITNWGAVPTMGSRLVEYADSHGLDEYDLSSLRTFTLSTAPSSAELKERIRVALPQAGLAMGTTYGLTESSTASTLASAEDVMVEPDSVGRPVPTMQVEIRSSDGQRVPNGAEGDIYIRGAQVMLGYWRNPEATAAAHAEHRWFRTGDIGMFVDGQLRISSRRSDLIIRAGENVYPVEVEHQLSAHPAVRECIVMGVPHSDLGEEVAAVVVLRPDLAVTAEDLHQHMCSRIARYKIPSRWRLTHIDLPRNATGKVNRAEVKCEVTDTDGN